MGFMIETYFEKDAFNHIVPMMRVTTEVIKGLVDVEETVFVVIESRVANWGRITVNSYSWRVTLYNAFLQLPFWSICFSPMARSFIRQRGMYLRMGA